MEKHPIIGVAVLLICVVLSGCTTTDTEYSVDNPSSDDIEILEHNMSYTNYANLVVNGTAKNIGEQQLSVQIKVKFYDENDVLIDTSFDYVSDVDPGEIFVFEIYCIQCDESYDHYTIGIGSVI